MTIRSEKLSSQLNLSQVYDWSNANIDEDVFILLVLEGCYIYDISKCVTYYGKDRVLPKLDLISDPLRLKIATRLLNNAIKASLLPANTKNLFNALKSNPKMKDLDSLFKSKSVVLMDRVKSRDLLDLMILIKDHGYTIEQVIKSIMEVDNLEEKQAFSALEVLIGNVPVDKDDPGFDTINIAITLEDIYDFFKSKVDEYEVDLAKSVLENTPTSSLKFENP